MEKCPACFDNAHKTLWAKGNYKHSLTRRCLVLIWAETGGRKKRISGGRRHLTKQICQESGIRPKSPRLCIHGVYSIPQGAKANRQWTVVHLYYKRAEKRIIFPLWQVTKRVWLKLRTIEQRGKCLFSLLLRPDIFETRIIPSTRSKVHFVIWGTYAGLSNWNDPKS